MGELLKISHLNYRYPSMEGETPVLFDVSFHVSDGEFIAIVGSEGCGKSTLLSLIAGLLSPSSGFLSINGKDIKSSGKNIGYMLQKDHFSEDSYLVKDATFGPEMQHTLSDSSYVQINDFMNTYGMINFISTYPAELSACTRQRVALIRSLLLESDIVLLDEPFSALKGQARLYAADDIWGMLRKEKKTVILATQDISEAICMADRVIVLSSFPETVKKIFDISLSEEMRTLTTAQDTLDFQEYLNLIKKEL